MSGIITELQYYFSYPFVRYALVVGVLVALCSSLFGVSLVLKRFSFIGDGLSHVAFGAMAFATMFKLANTTVLVMPPDGSGSHLPVANRAEHTDKR